MGLVCGFDGGGNAANGLLWAYGIGTYRAALPSKRVTQRPPTRRERARSRKGAKHEFDLVGGALRAAGVVGDGDLELRQTDGWLPQLWQSLVLIS